MPESNANWNFSFQIFCFNILHYVDYQFSIEITGDTVFNGMRYHKLNTPIVQSTDTACTYTYFEGYRGCYRNDSIAKKVYFISRYDSTEQILYDFNMQVGDTAHSYIFSGNETVVDHIDSVLVGSDYRKSWHFRCVWTSWTGGGDILIEGLGYTGGLIELNPGCTIDGLYITTECFKNNGVVEYTFGITDCNLIDQVNCINERNFSITPNPSNTFIRIENRSIAGFDVTLIDAKGSTLMKNLNCHSPFILDTENYSEGIYILTIETGTEKISHSKILIRH
jgi:hypothetical protein